MEEKKQQLTFFKVRDLRKKEKFIIDDAYLNGYARVCKPVATAVYNSLCRHAEFNSQKAFPSQELMAYQHGISVKTVRRGIKKLAEYKIILIGQERRGGRFTNYVYTLLDRSEWKPSKGQKRPMVNHREKTTGGKVPTKVNKGIRLTNNSMSAKPTEWDFNEKLKEMEKDSRRHIQIIALYWQEKNWVFKNEKQYKDNLNRELKPAAKLTGYTNEDIKATIKVLRNTPYLTKFTLETIAKYIPEVVNQKEKEGPKIVRFEQIKEDGRIVMRKIYAK